MRLVSFNVNGIRSRAHQLEAVVDRHTPFAMGLQETKVVDEAFPNELPEALGYGAAIHGQKGHYGVALLHREPAKAVQIGFPWRANDECRFIATRHALAGAGTLSLLNGYFPQGESRDHPRKFPVKQRFYADVLRYLREHCDPAQPVVLMGDMNVAPQDRDIGIGDSNRKRWLREGKCAFLPEEREWLQALQDWGLVDSLRSIHPDRDDCFSWFDYRSRGFEKTPPRGLRIDLMLISAPLQSRCRDAGIDYTIRSMQRPSDHCPVWVDIDLEP